MEAPDSIGRFHDKTIPEKYGVIYDSFPTNVDLQRLVFNEQGGDEESDLYYVKEVVEKTVSILPKKKRSVHFVDHLYQKIICSHCKQSIGYLYSPVDNDTTLVASCKY